MAQSENHGRFMPDWIVGGVIRLSLVPGLWYWGRANAGDWPEVAPEAVQAAARWAIPVISADQVALFAVWGAQLAALLLTIGFLTRFVGLALIIASAIFCWWIAPYAWTSIVVFAALAFYLMMRGAGGLSVDRAISATTR